MRTIFWLCVAILGGLSLSACHDSDSSSGVIPGGQDTPIGLTIDIGSLTNPTSELFVVVAGRAEQPGSTVIIEGGSDTVQTAAAGDRSFELTVPLHPNRKNNLYAREHYVGGAIGDGYPFEVVQDGQGPQLWIDSPQPDQALPTPTTTVFGRLSDPLSGFNGLEVFVNGIQAEVNVGIGTNGTFAVSNFVLEREQPTTITVTAIDAAKNETTKSIEAGYRPPFGFTLAAVSGNDQEGMANSVLSEPVVVRLATPQGLPLAGKLVTFTVTKSNGRLAAGQGQKGGSELQILSDSDGLARAYWRLGSDAGVANNRVEARSKDVSGVSYFCASALPGLPRQINVGTVSSQVTDPEAPAPEPLAVWVSDGCNGVPGVVVTYEIVAGSGATLRNEVTGQNSARNLTVTTGPTGHAALSLYAGELPGLYAVTANFAGNVGRPVRFTVLSLNDAPGGLTTFEGMVFDNAEQPLGGVSAILSVQGEVFEAVTNEEGYFSIVNITRQGPAALEIKGSSASTIDGKPINPSATSFPDLHYEPLIYQGRVNRLVGPIRLPPMKPANDRIYDGSRDVELTLPDIAGLAFVIKAGSMTLADGTIPGKGNPVTVSVNQVHHGDVPMPLPNGVAPSFAWTLQPAGAHFDPPIAVRYPNMAGLEPGSASYFLSFDHSTSQFEIVASGSVSADGSIITTDSGSGITVSGWGCNCPPYAAVGDCDNCVESCVSSGMLSVANAGDQVMASVSMLPPDSMTPLFFTAPEVVDSGGGIEVACSDGTGQSMPVAAGTITYAWVITASGNVVATGTGRTTSTITANSKDCPYSATFTATTTRQCAPPPLFLQSGDVAELLIAFRDDMLIQRNIFLTEPVTRMRHEIQTGTAFNYNLNLLLSSPPSSKFGELKWERRATEGVSFWTEIPAGNLAVTGVEDLSPYSAEIRVYSKACPPGLLDETNSIYFMAVARDSAERHADWEGAQINCWLGGLPRPYASLDLTSGVADPDPPDCDRWAVTGSLTASFTLDYHPGASYDVRCRFATGQGMHGHQATYNASGNLITGTAVNLGLAAGTADFRQAGTPGHVEEDVRSFVRAAHLDGNFIYFDAPMKGSISEKWFRVHTKLEAYLTQYRPALNPSDTGTIAPNSGICSTPQPVTCP